MWLVGSTPGATTGAAVAYDEAEDPSQIRAPWCVYDGSAWVGPRARPSARSNVDGEGRRYAVVDAKRVFGDDPLPAGGDGEVKRRSPARPARLAATVLAALAHEPYAAVFWRACEKAARREPPGAERRPRPAAGARGGRARRRRAARRRVARRRAHGGAPRRRAARTLSKSSDAHAGVLAKAAGTPSSCPSPAPSPSSPGAPASTPARRRRCTSACARPTSRSPFCTPCRSAGCGSWGPRRARPSAASSPTTKCRDARKLAAPGVCRRADVSARARRGRNTVKGRG